MNNYFDLVDKIAPEFLKWEQIINAKRDYEVDYGAIDDMIKLFKAQLNLIKGLKNDFENIKNSERFKIENDSKIIENVQNTNQNNKSLIFISYNVIDKVIAGEIFDFLNTFFEVFLAHEKIKSGVDWQEEIILNLQKADIFMPIITKSFKQSDWTDQECGIAYLLANLKNTKILPLNKPQSHKKNLPYGFISKFQSFPFTDMKKQEEQIEFFAKLLELINKNEKKRLFDLLVLKLTGCNTKNDCTKYTRMLLHFDITEYRLNKIFEAFSMDISKKYSKSIIKIFEDFIKNKHIEFLDKFKKFKASIFKQISIKNGKT